MSHLSASQEKLVIRKDQNKYKVSVAESRPNGDKGSLKKRIQNPKVRQGVYYDIHYKAPKWLYGERSVEILAHLNLFQQRHLN